MASSYTNNLRLVLPVQGELAGTWGDTVNAGLTNLVDTSVAGTASVTMTDADYTLTTANGAADQARAMFIALSGTLTAARNVICPSSSKLYFVTNSTTGGFAITFKTSAGTGISVPNGKSAVLYCNSTDVVNAISIATLSGGSIDGMPVGATTASTGAFTTLSASGAFSLSGDQVQVAEGGTGATTATNAKINLEVITAATGSAILPSGTTAERDATPIAGYIRFNSDLAKFEGYTGSAWSAVGGGATGGGSDAVFVQNGQTVTTTYAIPSGQNAMSTGPITINGSVTVTIPSDSRWVVL